MGRPRPPSVVLLLTLIYGLSGASLWAGTTEPHSVFQAFTSHIQRQVEADKQLFVDASSCTEWFYKRERDKSREPRAEGIALRPSRPGPDAPDAPDAPNAMGTERVSSIDCRSRYPRGLEGAREDFSRTQSTLSLSLTFYEFALVGDRDDDNQYSPVELRDILESFGLLFRPGLSPAMQLSTLNAQFDSVHYAGKFDVLMTGMTVLFEKGYRFTTRDVEALSRVMG